MNRRSSLSSEETMFKHSSFRTSISLVALLALIVACGAQPTAAPATSAPQPAATTAGTQPTTAAAQPSAAPVQPTTAPAGAAPGPKETLVYGMSADPTNLDPHSTVDGLSLVTMHRCYDKLVELKPGVPKPGAPLEVIPDAAESWTEAPDGLSYTFKLREGLKFADGSPLDANAVKWSFDRLMAINKSSASNIRQLKSTDAVDARTVKMTLSEPF